jgi:hypothetical protein
MRATMCSRVRKKARLGAGSHRRKGGCSPASTVGDEARSKLTGGSARAHVGVSVPTVAIPRHHVESARTDDRSVVAPADEPDRSSDRRGAGPGQPARHLLCGLTGILDPNALGSATLGQLTSLLNAILQFIPRTA